jgi:hypothetical protein
MLGALVCLIIPPAMRAQATDQMAPSQPASSQPALSQEQLQQLAAPIALYPDNLLAQILMASTYPLEIVEAERWAQSHPGVAGQALQQALLQEQWDPSVKSMVTVPDVLKTMSDQIDWTQKLGDAFLAQQADVLQAVQNLRQRAQNAGSLQTTSQQTVAAAQSNGKTYVTITPSNPEVVHVPSYNPSTAYGAWPYPSQPPYAFAAQPSGYGMGAAALTFGTGAAIGAGLWGASNWGHGNVGVNTNNFNNFNNQHINNPNWRHNPEHRHGAPYGPNSPFGPNNLGQHFGQGGSSDGFNPAREQFRNSFQQGLPVFGAHGNRPYGNRLGQPGNRPGQPGNQWSHNLNPSHGNLYSHPGAFQPRSHALEGMGQGDEIRRHSERGRQSFARFAGHAHPAHVGGGHFGGHGGGHFGGRRR